MLTELVIRFDELVDPAGISLTPYVYRKSIMTPLIESITIGRTPLTLILGNVCTSVDSGLGLNCYVTENLGVVVLIG